jgi:hypothetical protein
VASVFCALTFFTFPMAFRIFWTHKHIHKRALTNVHRVVVMLLRAVRAIIVRPRLILAPVLLLPRLHLSSSSSSFSTKHVIGSASGTGTTVTTAPEPPASSDDFVAAVPKHIFELKGLGKPPYIIAKEVDAGENWNSIEPPTLCQHCLNGNRKKKIRYEFRLQSQDNVVSVLGSTCILKMVRPLFLSFSASLSFTNDRSHLVNTMLTIFFTPFARATSLYFSCDTPHSTYFFTQRMRSCTRSWTWEGDLSL